MTASKAESGDIAGSIGPALLRWYRQNRRPLPWRKTRDPYAIWVSEVMLQQTRADTVLRYWRPFLERFPDVRSLAAARERDVLASWSGLGYYRRARCLHRAARELVRHHEGRLPADESTLRKLPGFGPYTAGAVASIAFGRRAPALDGNVTRVLARLFRLRGADLRTARLGELARSLVPTRSPGDWNQALMELGATICTPRRPACEGCPVRRQCSAAGAGQPERFPAPRKRPRTVRAREAVVIVERGDRILLRERRNGRLLRGVWEPPTVPLADGEAPEPRLRRVLDRLGVRSGPLVARGSFTHAITNRRIETLVFATRARSLAARRADWIRRADLGALPLSATGVRLRTGRI